ncbi:MAG TPA: sulfatase-like hydrolase/transferase [Candidatus Hydrogenedentes bacterium]|nr:sulfatase-like hydrolase/transferase [Candidatus Hydrogenedentota bacterium]HOV74316.1 sulfatase-like hydrolase/transferase [Candidatus Hydrogenedentota bacterium]HPC14991.1 sulfatase-like hydrolase/transferase [Candidatus Hydrogenedentota bacterium]HRT19148.1 sulfatase-like hydrolase/transferase [Candidatus Hydrogenedentota bacterium]HRT64077.1 sulfatase-like hydrolase/transferase [Candidatus Hydrogenedentota bacterium]
MNRRTFLGAATAGAAAAALGAQWPVAAKDKKPKNILYLLSDDQRFDTIHALGNPEIHTPHLDALAGRGVAFTNAYIFGSHHGALCAPSRAMIMSGRHLFHIEHPDTLPESVPLLPGVLHERGYATHGIGKWHNGRGSFNRAFASGSSIFFGGMSNQRAVPVHAYDPTGRYPVESAHVGDRFSSELFADDAIRFLQAHDGSNPFLLYVAFTAPHDPRTAPEAYRALYDPKRLSLPPNCLPRHPFDNGDLETRDEKLAPWPRTPENTRFQLAEYYAMISHLDEQIGRILAVLDETGLAEETLIVFAGDNGLAVGQHGLFGKQNAYEHSIHVPLLMAGPGFPRGMRCDAFCYLTDTFPTLFDLIGAPLPKGVDGRSLLPALRGEPVRDAIFFAYRDVQRAIRVGDYKLIEYQVKGERRTQLFDLARDPFETRDLSGEARHARTLKRLRERLRAMQRETDDPLAGRW